ncbi:DUF2683 family protein [Pedobacter sp.]
METLVIHPEDAEQSETFKAILKALKVKVEVFSGTNMVNEELPQYVTNLMNKALKEADQNQTTPHEDFMTEVKNRLKK